MSRDDFSLSTKRVLALRVAYKCSICKAPTAGPTKLTTSTVNIGEAAHIEGASRGVGAKRFNSDMTSEQRSHIDNGIWLCRNCHGAIDRDVDKYPTEELHKLKVIAEKIAEKEIGVPPLRRSDNTEDIAEYDDYSNLLHIISTLSRRHVSKLKVSEINKFYSILQCTQDDKYKVLANVIWLIIYHEYSSQRSPSLQMKEEAELRLGEFLDQQNILGHQHKELTKSIVAYSKAVKCLLM